MSASIIAPRAEDRAAFIAEYGEFRRQGLSGSDTRVAIAKTWGGRISRATMFRWFTPAEQAWAESSGEEPPPAPAPRPARRAAPQPAPAAVPELPAPTATTGGMLRIAHLPITEMLGEIIATMQGCMRYARGTNPEQPRNPNLALRAAAGLTQAIQTSLEVHAKFHDAAQMEQFTAAIMTELEQAEPALAQRVMERLDALAQQT